jgi:heme-dependent oxidative N-demethylase alpha subunit-like protein
VAAAADVWQDRAMHMPPPEAIYLPFESGSYRMSMSLTTVPESAWFELDERYVDEMRERRELLGARHGDVFAALPCSDEARVETLHEIVRNLCMYAPQWFVREGEQLRNGLTGESWDLGALPGDPLEVAGRLVQEDLCVIQNDADGPRLTAAVLCFPSRWRLHEKIGKPLAAVHGPVPHYAERLAAPVDRFMAKVKVGHIASRLNWSVLDDPAMYQPTGKWREASNVRVTPENAGDTLYLRVERQTLRRLPQSGAILFGIRVHSYRLARAITRPEDATRLAEAVRALPEATVHYKSLKAFGPALLAWLDAGKHRNVVPTCLGRNTAGHP